MTNSPPPHRPPNTCQVLCPEITLSPILTHFITFAVAFALNALAGSLLIPSQDSALVWKLPSYFGMLSDLPIPPIIFCSCIFLLGTSLPSMFIIICSLLDCLSHLWSYPCYAWPRAVLNKCLWNRWMTPLGGMLCPKSQGYSGEYNWSLVHGTDNLGNNHQHITISSSIVQPY